MLVWKLSSVYRVEPVGKERIDRSAWRTLFVLSSLALVTMYGETMVLPAIPNFISDFNITYNTSSWILSAYLISGAVMTPIAGKLSDIYGRKKVLLIIMSIYAAGILAGGFANSIEFMLVARVVQGIGISMFPIAFGIIRETFPEKKLAIGQGIFTSTFSGGAVVGLLVGATIIQNYGWHATFFSILPVAIILALIIIRSIRTDPPSAHEGKSQAKASKLIDVKGAITLASTIITFLVGLSYLEGGDSGYIVSGGFFAAAIVSLALFVLAEKRTTIPMIDLRLVVNKVLLPANIVMVIVGISTFMVYQTIPVMIQSPSPLGFGGTPVVTAAVQMPFMAISLVVSITGGFIVSRIGNVRLALIGTLFSTIGFFMLFMFHSTEFLVASTLAIISIGLSLSLIGGFNIVLVSVPIQASGVAIGMTVLLLLMGQSIGPSIAAVYQQSNQGTVEGIIGEFPTPQAYNLIFLTAAFVSVVSIAMVAMLLKRPPAVTTSTLPD